MKQGHNKVVELVIISGRSGAGKTVALHSLEDLGYYCVDNLPVVMLEDIVKLAKTTYPKLAVSIDVRNMPLSEEDLQKLNVIFIDADDQVLIKRYSETRRLHPLSLKNLSLKEAIERESDILKKIAAIADLRIDTTNLSIHDLCKQVITSIQGKPYKQIVVIFESFGFKDGVSKDADFVFDARFLPNPYWEKTLRSHNGLEEPIIKFFEKYPEVEEYIDKIDDLLSSIINPIEASDRSYLTVAIGCTGGYHRSVYIAQTLADRFNERGTCVKVRHRSLLRDNKI